MHFSREYSLSNFPTRCLLFTIGIPKIGEWIVKEKHQHGRIYIFNTVISAYLFLTSHTVPESWEDFCFRTLILSSERDLRIALKRLWLKTSLPPAISIFLKQDCRSLYYVERSENIDFRLFIIIKKNFQNTAVTLCNSIKLHNL